VKSPEHLHTYRLTPRSIWDARAAGLAAEQMISSRRATGESSLHGIAMRCIGF
jgi:hypothetical protein